MLADLHCHTRRCGHAHGSVGAYVQRAVELGMDAIGFSDHLPFVDREDRTLTMSRDELPAYVREVREVALGADGIEVLLGIEADFIPGTEDAVSALLDDHPFDYVLGSVHVLGDWVFDHPAHLERYESIDVDEFWAEYLATVRAAAATGLFDVLAHPDLAKKFDVRPAADLSGAYEALADTLAEAGMAIEVNTAGLFKPVAEIYPGRGFLELCRGRGIPVTLGSDAHAPDEVGRRFADAVALARDAGYEEAVLFRGRQAQAYRLPEAEEVRHAGE